MIPTVKHAGVPPVGRDVCAQDTSVLSDRALKNNEMIVQVSYQTETDTVK